MKNSLWWKVGYWFEFSMINLRMWAGIAKIRIVYHWKGLWMWIGFFFLAGMTFCFCIAFGTKETEAALRAFRNSLSNQ
jgi:hypothetical protein